MASKKERRKYRKTLRTPNDIWEFIKNRGKYTDTISQKGWVYGHIGDFRDGDELYDIQSEIEKIWPGISFVLLEKKYKSSDNSYTQLWGTVYDFYEDYSFLKGLSSKKMRLIINKLCKHCTKRFDPDPGIHEKCKQFVKSNREQLEQDISLIQITRIIKESVRMEE